MTSTKAGERATRILLTGSRRITDRATVINALTSALSLFPPDRPAELVHGGAEGVDTIGDELWLDWRHTFVEGKQLYLPPREFPAKRYPDLKAQNLAMVQYVARFPHRVCIAIADRWASRTGHCARLARRADIQVRDFGALTGAEHQPERSGSRMNNSAPSASSRNNRSGSPEEMPRGRSASAA